jgi:hypothetical protein
MSKWTKLLPPIYLASCLLISSNASFAQAPHGDHNADHNGFVLMYSTLHFEVVVQDGGGIDIYFSSEARAQLPAATVSDVVIEIERPDGSLEFVSMQISASGDFWTGESKPVTNEKSLVRAGFVFQGEPFFVDIPAAAFPPIMEKMNNPMVDLSEFDAH